MNSAYMNGFSYTIIHSDRNTQARLGIIRTPHGAINTPAYIPVGTQGSVKSLSADEVEALGTQMYFVNTYHMYLRPGIQTVKSLGGLHGFMHWDKPVITDSGGFQVFSLARENAGSSKGGRPSVKITDDSVVFRSHWDGSYHTFTPENSMQYQWKLGSDIHIAFDDCTPYPATYQQAKRSLSRTHAWALRSLAQHKTCAKLNGKKPYQALYGSVQGSVFEDLRVQSARFISSLDFDGFAIGGVSVGESKEDMVRVMKWVTPLLPHDKPRHLLGVGEIDDIFALVEHGIDTFDCVQPTRLARMGWLLQKPSGKKRTAKSSIMDITKSVYAKDAKPIDESCSCYSCSTYSRAYIHHLFRVRELLAYRIATIHNIHFMHRLVKMIRESIADGRFLELKNDWAYNNIRR